MDKPEVETYIWKTKLLVRMFYKSTNPVYETIKNYSEEELVGLLYMILKRVSELKVNQK